MAVITLIGIRDDGAPGIPSNYKLAATFTTDEFNREFGGTWQSQQKTLYKKYCGGEIPSLSDGKWVLKEWDMPGGPHGATVMKIVCKV